MIAQIERTSRAAPQKQGPSTKHISNLIKKISNGRCSFDPSRVHYIWFTVNEPHTTKNYIPNTFNFFGGSITSAFELKIKHPGGDKFAMHCTYSFSFLVDFIDVLCLSTLHLFILEEK